ncbi:uncharacterized protein LACBIDRAFT_327703 [Laccaria bicolor S238N-H82]|uniref:Predicted protein n=1 Tax=Laccaria bicolor (strain S238N-H82 / ATCC MYA-4686) TaxID=486041 RepID=B0DCL2_LACBS|nr:uncharacterized protein LACBIDRAFT_327703 [Laccaria bicolor S238N-H82]EDR07750.1 predicted protein [Laccaria bicolor S238N-H82]|eukprot:XP_001881539.1 predicted protein [Laccaria bicolor S238N-H82]
MLLFQLSLPQLEPGHESSDTTGVDAGRQGSSATVDLNAGLSGGEHTSEDQGNPNVTQETADGDTNVILAGMSGNGQQQPSPGRNKPNAGDPQNDNSPFEQESINLMDNIIESFQRKEVMKLKALSTSGPYHFYDKTLAAASTAIWSLPSFFMK